MIANLLERGWRAAMSILCCATLVSLPLTGTYAQQTTVAATTYSGEAAAFRASVLGLTDSIADTGSLSASGGARQASTLSFGLPGLGTAETAHATVIGHGNSTESEASMANFRLTIGADTIGSSFLMARVVARCTPKGVSVGMDPTIVGLHVNGQPMTVTTQPNYTVPLPDGKIIFNEQAKSSTHTSGKINVSAMHVVINGVADILVASANAGISCPAQPPCDGDDDFITGGGFITGTPSGAEASFGVAGGVEVNGRLFGHLEYIDHGGNGVKVHGTSVTRFTVLSTTEREIEGTAEVNGKAGFTYHVIVSDADPDPGTDFFSIELSDGYHASGNLVCGRTEIHKPCKPS
jgi:hypothetical protein